MFSLRSTATFLISILGVMSIGFAQTPSDESVRELLDVTNVRGLVDNMQAQMAKAMDMSMKQVSAGHELSSAQSAVMKKQIDRFQELIKDELDWSVLEPLYLGVYRDALTQEEVDAMIAFYKTPIGQSVITKMPIVMEKSMERMQARMGPMIQKLQQIQRETAQELEALSAQEEAMPAKQ